MNKFTVFYEDGTKFEGDPLARDWNKIDETKSIVKLEYYFNNVGVMMEGYKQYNHALEHAYTGKKGLQRILLMGRTNEESELIILDLANNKCYKDYKPAYREYGDQILNGWQKGKLGTPKAAFKKIN
jgi:hypothetical protein